MDKYVPCCTCTVEERVAPTACTVTLPVGLAEGFRVKTYRKMGNISNEEFMAYMRGLDNLGAATKLAVEQPGDVVDNIKKNLAEEWTKPQKVSDLRKKIEDILDKSYDRDEDYEGNRSSWFSVDEALDQIMKLLQGI